MRLSEDCFYLVCAAFFEQRLIDHLNHYLVENDLEVVVRSNKWSAIAVQGPKSRVVLAANTDAELNNNGFRWLTARSITVAGYPVWALRISYTGELGWELHGPRENMLGVYDALWASGQAYDVADYGSFAMNTMRMEKMFKGAGELTNEVTLPEADVMRFVKMDKDDFVGKAETQNSLERELRWVCAYLRIESDGVIDGHGGEAVFFEGNVVGSITSVAYGHRVGSVLAFAYIKPYAARPGTMLRVMTAGSLCSARVLIQPAYDPDNVLLRADAI